MTQIEYETLKEFGESRIISVTVKEDFRKLIDGMIREEIVFCNECAWHSDCPVESYITPKTGDKSFCSCGFRRNTIEK